MNYKLIAKTTSCVRPIPYLHNISSKDPLIYTVSPIHCRSFIVGRHDDGRYIVSKGNGLAYSQYSFLHTPELPQNVWGLLRKEDALRDFYCGQDVQKLGIKTNQMECILEIDYSIHIRQTDEYIYPVLLQYNVECPYRIADAGFMDLNMIQSEVEKWRMVSNKGFSDDYLIAADILIRNLQEMHNNGILHNALTYENVTWALELLDFEVCHTPQHPYSNSDYLKQLSNMYDREIFDIYKIINYIAGVLRQKIDFSKVDQMFMDYGFDIKKYKVNF